LRITGGKARGIPLKVNTGMDSVRPATDRMRESLFSSIATYVDGSRFLDLFAGFGSYGLEALSRGCLGGTFIEKDRRAAKLCHENLAAVTKSLRYGRDTSAVRCCDVFVWKPAEPNSYDLIFADPPYALLPGILERLLAKVETCISEDGIFLLEAPGHIDTERPGWECLRRLGKGTHQPSVSVLRRVFHDSQ